MTDLDRALAALEDGTVLPRELSAWQYLDYHHWCRLDNQVERIWKRAGRERP